MVILFIILSIPCLVLLWHFITLKYLNPYKLYFVFGKKGSGKSTLLTKLAFQYLTSGKDVFSTEDLTFTWKNNEYSTILFEPKKIYTYDFPPGSIILIDEVSLIWDNRNFKNMDPKVVEWFRYQRHHKCIVYLFSQSFDIDKKLRDLSDDMYLVTKIGRVIACARHMVRKPVVVHPSEDSPARIDDDIVQDGLLLAPFGGCMLASIPKWSKFYDSFCKPKGSTLPSAIQPKIADFVIEEVLVVGEPKAAPEKSAPELDYIEFL